MKGKELLIDSRVYAGLRLRLRLCANFEEFLAFVPLVLACCLAMGFDSLTAVGIIFCAGGPPATAAPHQRLYHRRGPEHCGPAMFSGMNLRVPLFLCCWR